MSGKIDITEIVDTIERDGMEFDVCATAQGNYDAANSRLELTLDSFLRPVDLLHKERHQPADWLPPSETVREGVPWEESSRLAKEIFHRWAGKVRQSIPPFANPQPETNHDPQIQHRIQRSVSKTGAP